MNFGTTPSFGTGSFQFGAATATSTSAAPATISFGMPSQQPQTTSSLFGAITSAQSTSATSLSTSSAPTLGAASTLFGVKPATAATTATFSFGSTSSQSTTAGKGVITSAAPVSSSTAVGSSTLASADTSKAMNFVQLEEQMNNWTADLNEQEKVFIDLAVQINTWDQVLLANSDKIIELNKNVEAMKLQQTQLEQELDFILSQQRELEDCLKQVEDENMKSESSQESERDNPYKLAEVIDVQLRMIGEDLREVIEHLNEANRSQDVADPIAMISKILNHHTNSLQWIDKASADLQNKLEQATKLQDRSFKVYRK